MASAVLVTLLFLMPLFHYTPNVILGAIIITAVVGLIDYQAAFRLWKVDKIDFLACICSFFGVLFISVPVGLAIAVSYLVLLGNSITLLLCYLFYSFSELMFMFVLCSLTLFNIFSKNTSRLVFRFLRFCCTSLGQTLLLWDIFRELRSTKISTDTGNLKEFLPFLLLLWRLQSILRMLLTYRKG